LIEKFNLDLESSLSSLVLLKKRAMVVLLNGSERFIKLKVLLI